MSAGRPLTAVSPPVVSVTTRRYARRVAEAFPGLDPAEALETGAILHRAQSRALEEVLGAPDKHTKATS